MAFSFGGCANFWILMISSSEDNLNAIVLWADWVGLCVVVKVFALCCAKMVHFVPRFYLISFLCLKKKNQKGNQASHVLWDDFISQDVYNRFMFRPWSTKPKSQYVVKFNASTSSVMSYTPNPRPAALFCPRFVSDYCHGTNWKSKVCHWIIVTLCFKERCLYVFFFF